jgi:hypothetical protein
MPVMIVMNDANPHRRLRAVLFGLIARQRCAAARRLFLQNGDRRGSPKRW